jgi:hypothetical protein
VRDRLTRILTNSQKAKAIDINLGDSDRIIRIVPGFALLTLITLLDSPWRWWGFAGFLPFASGMVAICPIYSLLGISTCRQASGVRKD